MRSISCKTLHLFRIEALGLEFVRENRTRSTSCKVLCVLCVARKLARRLAWTLLLMSFVDWYIFEALRCLCTCRLLRMLPCRSFHHRARNFQSICYKVYTAIVQECFQLSVCKESHKLLQRSLCQWIFSSFSSRVTEGARIWSWRHLQTLPSFDVSRRPRPHHLMALQFWAMRSWCC